MKLKKKIKMKKQIILLMLLFTVVLSTYSQEETVVVKKYALTTEQLKSIEQEQSLQETKQTVEKYGEIAGLGKEIGVAINDGLNAVVGASEKFGKIDVGKFTIMIIAWKFLYKDFIGIFIGVFLLLIVNVLIFKSFKSFTIHRQKTSGAWYQFWVVKEYKIIEPDDSDGVEFVKILHIAFSCISFAIAYGFIG